MSTAKHTAGPWTAHVMTREVSVEAPCGRVLFLANIDGDEETIADAYVIAAAPALLAAATAFIEVEQTMFGSPEFVTYSARYAAAVDSLRAAIAQADGATG